MTCRHISIKDCHHSFRFCILFIFHLVCVLQKAFVTQLARTHTHTHMHTHTHTHTHTHLCLCLFCSLCAHTLIHLISKYYTSLIEKMWVYFTMETKYCALEKFITCVHFCITTREHLCV